MDLIEIAQSNPEVIYALLAYYVFNAAVQALPDPKPEGSRFYLFFYNFLHTVAGNIGLVRKQLRVRVE